MVMHQKYENEVDQPLEIQFMMPISEQLVCSKIGVVYFLPNGTTEQYETRVVEREKAVQQYEDSAASGETAVLATLPPIGYLDLLN